MGSEIVVEWDERKRRANLCKHGYDFADCAEVFSGPVHTMVDDRYEYGETRFQTQGLLRGAAVVVTHTEEDGVMRVISLRRATTYEQEEYFKNTFQD
jgi:uncharacterized DUF497 family protein